MSDQEFRERILSALNDLKDQIKTTENRTEKRFDSIEKRFDSIENRLDSIDQRVGSLERDVGWIKGKLEGRQETGTRWVSFIAVGTAVVSAVIALIALVT